MKAAIIGAGGVSSTQHAPALAKINDVQLVAICDMNEERARELADKYGARPYTDYEEMLSKEKPDIVHVCTPEAFHFEPVMASLEAGAHVFCEKVMAESIDKARTMVRRALELGRILGVNYNYRFIPGFKALKGIIDSGELGEIAMVNVYAHSYCMHHSIDLLRFLCGEVVEIAAMHTRWDREEGALPLPVGKLVYAPTRNEGVIMRFENGAVATLVGSLYSDLRENMVRLDIVGDKGRASVDQVRIDDISGRLTVYPEGRDIPLCTEEERAQGFDLAFARSIEHFVETVRLGGYRAPSGIDGLRAVEVEEAVVKSQESRGFIPLPRLACGSLAYSQLSLEDALKRIAGLGIPFVDVAIQEGWAHINPSDIANDVDGAIARLKEACSAAGVVPISINVGLGTTDHHEESRRMEAVAKLAQALGVRMVTLPGLPVGTPIEEEVERGKRLVEAAKPYGVLVTLETHTGQTTEDPQAAVRIAESVPGLGLTLDPSHYYAGPSQGDGFDVVLPYVQHVHLRDGGKSMDHIQVAVGRGSVDFTGLLDQLKAYGYTGEFVIEYIDTIGDLDTENEVRAMRSLFEDVQ